MKNLILLLLFTLGTSSVAAVHPNQIKAQINIVRDFVDEVKQSALVSECDGILNPRFVSRVAVANSASAEVRNAYEKDWLLKRLNDATVAMSVEDGLVSWVAASENHQYNLNRLVEFIQSTRSSLRLQQSRFVVAVFLAIISHPDAINVGPSLPEFRYMPQWLDSAFKARDSNMVLEFVTMMLENLQERAESVLGRMDLRAPRQAGRYYTDYVAERKFKKTIRALNALVDLMNAGSLRDPDLLARALPLAVDDFVIARILQLKNRIDLIPTDELKQREVRAWLENFVRNSRT